MVSTRRSSTAVGFPPLRGRFTSMPRYIMGAVSMKMRSSTRTTSTRGMTLISARALRVPAPSPPASALIAILEGLSAPYEPALDQVGQLEREVVHLGCPVTHQPDEVVVADDGRNRRRQTGRGRDQRARDTGRDDREARRSLRADGLERAHDADDRAQEADEGPGAGGRREEREVALHALHLSRPHALHGPLDGLQAVRRDGLLAWLGRPVHHVGRRRAARRQLLVRGEVDASERALAEPLRPRGHQRESARLAVRLEEPPALARDHPELEHLVEDDRPRDDGHYEEDREDDLLERADFTDDLAETTKTGKPCHDAQTLEP